MYIPLRKKTKKVIKLTESELRGIIREMILEELGSFPNQYETSNIIADAVIEAANSLTDEDIRKIRSNVPLDIVKHVDNKNLSVVRIQFLQDIAFGCFLGINTEENSAIIGISYKRVLASSRDDIVNTIQHELMHGNTYLRKAENVGTENLYGDIPHYYGELFNIFSNYEPGNIVYNFAHAMYSCYYDETNALVSQVYSDIMRQLNNSGKGKITEDEFINMYRNTNSYEEFKLATTNVVPVIQSMSDAAIEKFIVNEFVKNGINISVAMVKKQCKRIDSIANEALKDCSRNASLCYKHLIEQGRIIGKEKYEE